MSNKRILHATKTHSDTDDIFPEPGRNTDSFRFTVPKGQKYNKYAVNVKSRTLGSGYRVISAPRKGATGKQNLRVRWWHPPFGTIKYEVVAYSTPIGSQKPKRVAIYVDSPNWVDKANDVIEQKLPFQLRMHGIAAHNLHNQIVLLSGREMAVSTYQETVFPSEEPEDESGNGQTFSIELEGGQTVNVSYSVKPEETEAMPADLEVVVTSGMVITATICIALVAGLTTAVLGGVLLAGINAGYTIRLDHKLKGPNPFDDQLFLELIPPNG